MEGLTFRPQITVRQGVKGKLELDDGYVTRLHEETQRRREQAEQQSRMREEAELSQCTFKPAINTVPDHIKKLIVRPASPASLAKPAKVPSYGASYGGRHGY